MTKEPMSGSFVMCFRDSICLELFEEIARRAGDIHSARSTALTILDTLDDAGGFGALGTIRALVGVHDLLTVAGLGNLRHNACSPWYECCGSRAGCIDELPPSRASRIESSGTSRKDCPGLGPRRESDGEELRLRLFYKSTRQRPIGRVSDLPQDQQYR
jgi:hypothetical protein